MKPGTKVTIPRFNGQGIIGTRKARAYQSGEGPWMTAHPTGHGANRGLTWNFQIDIDEGVLWCCGWSGKAVRALKTATALL